MSDSSIRVGSSNIAHANAAITNNAVFIEQIHSFPDRHANPIEQVVESPVGLAHSTPMALRNLTISSFRQLRKPCSKSHR